MFESAIHFGVAVILSTDALAPRLAISRADELNRAGDIRGAENALMPVVSSPDLIRKYPEEIALARGNLGALYQDLSRPAEAERQYVKADALLRGKSTPLSEILRSRISLNLASLFLETGQHGKAERIISELSKRNIEDKNDAARLRGTIGSLHMVRGRYEEARREFLAALEWWNSQNDSMNAAVVLNNLGVLAMEQGDTKVAEAHLSEGVRLWQTMADPDSPASLRGMANYGAALVFNGKGAAAKDILERALGIAKRWHGENTLVTAQVAMLYSAALDTTGSKKEAKRLRTETQRIGAALAAIDPAVHTADILDLARRSPRKFR